ncbi:MAG: hypothetical protein ACI9SS_000469 [Gammaproteobacteria bacterium]|jgi:hypothetical protein
MLQKWFSQTALVFLELALWKKCNIDMKDFANRGSSNRNTRALKKNKFRSKKRSIQVFTPITIMALIFISAFLVSISYLYFDTDIKNIEPRIDTNKVTIDFPTSLMNGSVLIEADISSNLLSCDYFVQIGAYGNKKYAYEAENSLKEIEFISINEIYSSSNPGKILFSVLSGPYPNRSAANNAKEKITKKGFDPQLRTLCKKN